MSKIRKEYESKDKITKKGLLRITKLENEIARRSLWKKLLANKK